MTRSLSFTASLLVGLGFLGGTLAKAAEPPAPKGGGVDPKVVDKAVADGVAWLLKKMRPDGTFDCHGDVYPIGGTALCWLAIIKSGELKKGRQDPRFLKALQWMKDEYYGQRSIQYGRKTYSIGILLMLLEAKPPNADKRQTAVIGKEIEGMDDWIKDMVKWLEETHLGKKWSYYGQGGIEDNSNTQYALLGLKAASRMGHHVSDPEVYLKTIEHLMEDQDTDGPGVQPFGEKIDPRHTSVFTRKARGWGYQIQAHPSTGSMTTAAVAGLTIMRDELLELDKRRRQFTHEKEEALTRSINDGLGWLAYNFSVTANPFPNKQTSSGWHYYYLYGLERVGMLCGMPYIGQHNWYHEGARVLLDQQFKDGEDKGKWDTTARGVAVPGHMKAEDQDAFTDTSYAILFLKKATTPVEPIPEPVITEAPGSRKR